MMLRKCIFVQYCIKVINIYKISGDLETHVEKVILVCIDFYEVVHQ